MVTFAKLIVPFNSASTSAFSAMFLTVALALKTSWSMANDKLCKFTYVSFIKPVSFTMCVSITMFLTDFGKSGYWNEALFEAIFTSKVGMVVSVKFPFTFPSTENCPVVFTLLISPEYAAGINPKKFLKSEVGVLNVKS